MRSLSIVPCLLAILFVSGCADAKVPDVGEVTGTVTFDGKPASGIIVNFTPVEGGRTSTAVTDESGNYTLQYSPNAMGALVGSHNVTIAAEGPSADVGGPTSGPLVDKTIPKEYQSTKKQVEVKEGDNTIDLTYP